MKASAASVLFAMLVGVAMASQCSDECQGACNVAKSDCHAAYVYGPLCEAAHDGCNKGCDAVCGCVDGCQDYCEPAFEQCEEAAGDNLLAGEECVIQNDICASDCEAACAVQAAVNTATSVFQSAESADDDRRRK